MLSNVVKNVCWYVLTKQLIIGMQLYQDNILFNSQGMSCVKLEEKNRHYQVLYHQCKNIIQTLK